MLTPADETNLLTALFSGPLEQPYWTSFLDRLLKRTRADHVGLLIARPGQPIQNASKWSAGRDLHDDAYHLSDPVAVDPTPYQRLRPGRVYATMELFDPQIGDHDRFRHDYPQKRGIGQGRYMRVVEPGGVNCWLTILREKSDFSAADGAVLSSLAPHISVALQLLRALEFERFKLAIATDALERVGISCALQEAEARTLDRGTGEGDRASASLHYAPSTLGYVTPPQDSTVALTRQARPFNTAQVEAAMEQFGLTGSEARLALHLAEGHSLQEAGTLLHLTRETARNYSKRIYEKTGSRGQADLVRLLLTSVVTLA